LNPFTLEPEILKKLESKAVKVKVAEGERKSVSVKQISWEELEKAR